MGQASCYISIPDSSYYLSAEISWNSSYYVTVNVTTNYQWRLKRSGVVGDAENIFAQYGSLSNGGFQGQLGTTYVFQMFSQNEKWYQDTFTITDDSGGDDDDDDDDGGDSGGGNPGSGGSGEGGSGVTGRYLVQLFTGNYIWDVFPSSTMKTQGVDLIIAPLPSRSPTLSSEISFEIKGNANGGAEDTSMTAYKQTQTEYRFTGWTDNYGNKWYDRYTYDNHASLYAGQEEIETTVYSNNTLTSLPKPTRENDIIKYNVVYDSKGGTALKDYETVEKNIKYYFDYWCSDPSGNGEQYSDSSSFTEDAEVYAIWGEQDSDSSVVLPIATRNGYRFAGWATEDQSTLLPAGAVVNIDKDMIFNAVWESEGRIFIHNGTTWVVII